MKTVTVLAFLFVSTVAFAQSKKQQQRDAFVVAHENEAGQLCIDFGRAVGHTVNEKASPDVVSQKNSDIFLRFLNLNQVTYDHGVTSVTLDNSITCDVKCPKNKPCKAVALQDRNGVIAVRSY